MRTAIAAVAAALLLAGVPSAAAHQGNPNMRSEVTAITPATDGITVTVLNNDDRLALHNTSGEDVVIAGYEGEPYARVLAGGAVEVNTNSPAHYLNDDRYGDVKVPDGLGEEPKWERVSATGRFEWHDHRMHWMSKSRPPQVKDAGIETPIFDWNVPITVGGTDGRISGSLTWVPLPGGGLPAGLIWGTAAVLILLCVAVIALRRRRAAGESSEPAEAW